MGNTLAGVRVLDLTQFESGPSCTLLLAYLGAEVIKIEKPETGESGRSLFSEKGSEGDCWYFIMLNSNKKSVTLNLKSEKGKEIFKKMVKMADVVVENFTPGVIDSLGLGYEVLREVNPSIIYASASGYGLSGMYRDYPCFDIVAQAMGGVMSCNGLPDSPPIRCGPSIGDVVGGINLALGIVAALYYREKTGEGEFVEVSLQESMVSLLRSAYQGHYHTGKPIPRVGSRFVGISPWDTYPAKDGYVVIGAITVEQWKSLCRLMGREELAVAPGFELSADRYWKHRDEVDKIVSDWTSGEEKREIMEKLVSQGIPCGMVLDSGEILEDPHLLERGMVVEITHPQRGTFKQLGLPIKLKNLKTTVTAAPLLGQDNDEIYTRLGYTRQQLQELQDMKII